MIVPNRFLARSFDFDCVLVHQPPTDNGPSSVLRLQPLSDNGPSSFNLLQPPTDNSSSAFSRILRHQPSTDNSPLSSTIPICSTEKLQALNSVKVKIESASINHT
ncbi:uncharacterized protein A4U43_C07F4030 [Asparagus officinalis]|uniref:Uncharacterized protein n=1 Tax=Asparagus officinalis TaxID=4686 RepID=A0A5P1E986_ASPOF|nr:uncharacterized protein A4U43_C07F4030 [Asparagus officinalis]